MPSVTINMRISALEKKWLKEMAALSGMSLSAFIRHAATVEARRVLWKSNRLKPGFLVTDEQIR